MTKKRSRRTTLPGWIERGKLAPWMNAYALWLAKQPQAELSRLKGEGGSRCHQPTSVERIAAASKFAARRIDREKITLLERRDDFRTYFEQLRADHQFFAQEQMRDDITENIDARRHGLRKAADRKEDDKGVVTFGDDVDHRAIERYTNWVPQIAFPKKIEKAPAPQRFTINLFGMPAEQKKLLLKAVTEEEPEALEYEIIPNDKILTDGRDDD